jgi:hypothetical protein
MEDRFEKEHFEVEFILFYLPSTYFYVYLLTGFSPDFAFWLFSSSQYTPAFPLLIHLPKANNSEHFMGLGIFFILYLYLVLYV